MVLGAKLINASVYTDVITGNLFIILSFMENSNCILFIFPNDMIST